MLGRSRLLLYALFVGSGAAGLVFEVVLQRELTRAFGVSAWATSTVLAAYMAGTAAGAAVIGRRIDRLARPLRLYAALELGIAVCALLTHPGARGLVALFTQLAHGAQPNSAAVAVLRLVLAFVFCLPPTFLMGGTLPALARGLTELLPERTDSSRAVALLYTANLLGAAGGTLLVTYGVLPAAGLSRSLLLGAALNVFAAALAILLDRRASRIAAPGGPASTGPESTAPRMVLVAAAWSGFVTFGYEVVWTQLLSVVVGSSAYAFGLMLAIFLSGLMLGSLLAQTRRWSVSWRTLGMVALLSSIAVAVTLPLWDRLPAIFLWAGPWARTFARRELVRAGVCFAGLLAPSLFLGGFYPLLLRWAAQEASVGKAVGGVAAVNTLGSVFGSLVAGFILLPAMGMQGALELLAAGSCVVAALCFRGSPGRQLGALAVAAAVGLVPAWSYERLSTGANIYFEKQGWVDAPMVFSRESVVSGLTTVLHVPESGAYVLLSNGKFQGSSQGEIAAQYRFAQVPLLLTRGVERALLIGVGTGGSAAALASSPFKSIEVAELAPDIVEASREYFRAVNFGVLASDRISLQYADGRNLLMLSDRKYDLVTLEVTSIWIAGEADLYNREFYQLARAHLAPHGLVQQWVQLHHMTRRDLAIILQTARSVLPHVVLFYAGGQGQMVAGEEPIVIDYPHVMRMNAESGMPALDQLPGADLLTVGSELMLDEAGVTRLIEDEARVEGVRPEELVSTDDNLVLEYETPKGNLTNSMALLGELRHADRAPLPVVGISAPGQKEHVVGAALAGVSARAGPGKGRALVEQAAAHLRLAVARGAPGAQRLLNAAEKHLALPPDKGAASTPAAVPAKQP